MTGDHFKVYKWLTGLVVLMVLPSVMLAALQIRAAVDEVRKADQALAGLHVIQQLHPLIEMRILDTVHYRPDRLPPAPELAFVNPETATEIGYQYDRAVLEESDVEATLAIRDLLGTIAHGAGLYEAAPEGMVDLPALLSSDILSAAYQNSQLYHTVQTVHAKETLNSWDRMSVPVRGGQFKVVSDAIAQKASRLAEKLDPQARQRLLDATRRFNRANSDFQGAAAAFVRAMSSGSHGRDLPIAQLGKLHETYIAASCELWFEMTRLMTASLRDHKSALISTLKTTVAISIMPIAIALVIAIVISRAFAARARRQLDTVGFNDPVTGLPNRRSLMRTLNDLRNAPPDTNGPVSVLHVDLRRFKAVNDSHGEQAGDELLRQIARELTEGPCAADFVARTGGNEFTILCQRMDSRHALCEFARSLIADVSKKRRSGGLIYQVSACIGIASLKDTAFDQILVDASIALKVAKSGGLAEYRYCDAKMRKRVQSSNTIAAELKHALAQGHIEPWFQPQVCIRTGRLTGFEALVRWVDPERGVISPGYFLGAAEEAGLMDELDAIVRHRSLAVMGDLRRTYGGDWQIGLNMSAELLADPKTIDRLMIEIEEAGLPHNLIGIEILESVVIDEAAAMPIKKNITRLAKMGFHIELDDFGTGHSSLSSLRDLKVNRVKIDRSFISGIDADGELQTITMALIQLARTLNVEVLAEGVETEGELQWLRHHGCDLMQGFLVGKPMSEADLANWVPSYEGVDASNKNTPLFAVASGF